MAPQVPPTASSLRVAIATTGRFYVLDLARELDRLGHEVRLYTLVPPGRAEMFGLPRRCHVFLFELLPLALLIRYGPKRFRPFLTRLLARWANMAVKARMHPCDVFVGMSGIILEAFEDARARFGARIVVDRGSRHILSQAEILARLPGAEGPSAFDISRELAGYAVADRIALPSRHAVGSFRERGIPEERIIYNPYGVDLASFCPPAPAPAREPDLVLFVGLWCLRKGVDLLTTVIERNPNLRLLHAGAVGDLPFPEHPRMQSLGHIDQTKLSALYAQAAVAVLPSREDGYGLVLCQALACGTPIVASDRTGAPDLATLIAKPEAVTLFASDDEQALDEALASAISTAPNLAGQDLLGDRGRAYLSWEGYGQRYARAIADLIQDRDRS